MKRISTLLPLWAAALAGCQDAPTAAPAGTRANLTNQPPVAVIQVIGRKPLIGGKVRVTFSGTSSYDPDGTITQYYWYPEYYCRVDPAYGNTYYMDIPAGESCGLTLTVTDNGGATDSEVQYFTQFD